MNTRYELEVKSLATRWLMSGQTPSEQVRILADISEVLEKDAYAAGRADALEDAAKIAEVVYAHCARTSTNEEIDVGGSGAAKAIEVRIRALKGTP